MNTTTCYIPVPVSERLPEKEGVYCVFFRNERGEEKYADDYFDGKEFSFSLTYAWLEKKEIQAVGGVEQVGENRKQTIDRMLIELFGLLTKDEIVLLKNDLVKITDETPPLEKAVKVLVQNLIK